jgi:hypothetical protein
LFFFEKKNQKTFTSAARLPEDVCAWRKFPPYQQVVLARADRLPANNDFTRVVSLAPLAYAIAGDRLRS